MQTYLTVPGEHITGAGVGVGTPGAVVGVAVATTGAVVGVGVATGAVVGVGVAAEIGAVVGVAVGAVVGVAVGTRQTPLEHVLGEAHPSVQASSLK